MESTAPTVNIKMRDVQNPFTRMFRVSIRNAGFQSAAGPTSNRKPYTAVEYHDIMRIGLISIAHCSEPTGVTIPMLPSEVCNIMFKHERLGDHQNSSPKGRLTQLFSRSHPAQIF